MCIKIVWYLHEFLYYSAVCTYEHQNIPVFIAWQVWKRKELTPKTLCVEKRQIFGVRTTFCVYIIEKRPRRRLNRKYTFEYESKPGYALDFVCSRHSRQSQLQSKQFYRVMCVKPSKDYTIHNIYYVMYYCCYSYSQVVVDGGGDMVCTPCIARQCRYYQKGSIYFSPSTIYNL